MARKPLTIFDRKLRMIISSNIKRLMGDMTQAQLSDLTGIPQSTLSGYIAERSTPHPDQVQRLADTFGVPKSAIDPRFDTEQTELTNLKISPQARQVITSMNKLNSLGQDKVVDYADDLTHNSQYSKLQEAPVEYKVAAYDGNLSDEDRDAIIKMVKEIEDDEDEQT